MANTNKLRCTMTGKERTLGWIYLLFELFLLPRLLNWGNHALGSPLSAAWVNFLFFCVNFIAVLLLFHRFLGASLSALGRNFGKCLKAAFLGFCVYYVSNMALGNLLTFLFPWFTNVNDSSVSSMLRLDYLPMVIGTVFLVPTVEEILHRGVVFQGIYSQNHRLGYLVSTAVFCAVHVMGYIGSAEPLTLLLCFIQYIPAGLCLAWAYAEADNIFAPILIHTVINAMGIYAVR